MEVKFIKHLSTHVNLIWVCKLKIDICKDIQLLDENTKKMLYRAWTDILFFLNANDIIFRKDAYYIIKTISCLSKKTTGVSVQLKLTKNLSVASL